MRHTTLFFALLSLVAAGACSPRSQDPSEPRPLRIGLSMESLQLERWQRDRDHFVRRAQELGAEVLVQSAESSDAVQLQQVENLLTQRIDVLVIVPRNAEVAASMVSAAKRQGVPVISYDRLIRNSDVDLYISFDNVRVGELQARYLLERAPRGNYILIGGSPTDNNARLLREGQMKVLQPAIEQGAIRVVADQWARDWLPSEALRHTENALTQARNQVAAVLASNDSTAGGAVQALREQNLAGTVLVSGQDADLTALQRIAAGTQVMTVYKPIAPLARAAAEAAVALARHQSPPANATVHNGMKDVPAILLDPIPVDAGNLAATVVRDGFHSLESIYRDLPRERWPVAPPEAKSP